MVVASITSPASRAVLAFSTVVLPSAPTSSMRTLVAAGTVVDFRTVEIARRHVRDMRLRVRRPRAHLVRVVACVFFDGAGGAAVRIAFAQHRVHGGAEHFRRSAP